jgi:hypothetical protein
MSAEKRAAKLLVQIDKKMEQLSVWPIAISPDLLVFAKRLRKGDLHDDLLASFDEPFRELRDEVAEIAMQLTDVLALVREARQSEDGALD